MWPGSNRGGSHEGRVAERRAPARGRVRRPVRSHLMSWSASDHLVSLSRAGAQDSDVAELFLVVTEYIRDFRVSHLSNAYKAQHFSLILGRPSIASRILLAFGLSSEPLLWVDCIIASSISTLVYFHPCITLVGYFYATPGPVIRLDTVAMTFPAPASLAKANTPDFSTEVRDEFAWDCLPHPLIDRCALLVVLAVVAGRVTGTTVPIDGDDDAELLQQARSIFKPLPKDMGTPEFPVTPDASAWVACCSSTRASRWTAPGAACTAINRHSMVPTVCPSRLECKTNISLETPRPCSTRGFTPVSTGTAGSRTSRNRRSALLGPGFGNPDFPTAMARVKAIPGYASLFQQAFPGEADPISEDNWGKAIGAYERTLVSPSRFDDYLGASPTHSRRLNVRDCGPLSRPAVSTVTGAGTRRTRIP